MCLPGLHLLSARLRGFRAASRRCHRAVSSRLCAGRRPPPDGQLQAWPWALAPQPGLMSSFLPSYGMDQTGHTATAWVTKGRGLEPRNNSWGEEAGHFLKDCQWLRLCAQAPGRVLGSPTLNALCCSMAPADRGARHSLIQSPVFARVHCSQYRLMIFT